MRAALSQKLPVLVLLGTNTPDLEELLQRTSQVIHTEDIKEALVVTIRAQVRQERESPETKRKNAGAKTKKITEEAQPLSRSWDEKTPRICPEETKQ